MNPILIISGIGLLFLISKNKSKTTTKELKKDEDNEVIEKDGEIPTGPTIPGPKPKPVPKDPYDPRKPSVIPHQPPVNPLIKPSKSFILKDCKFEVIDPKIAYEWAFREGKKYSNNDFTDKLFDGCNLFGITANFNQKQADIIFEILRNAVSGSVLSGKMSENTASLNLEMFRMKFKLKGLNTSKWNSTLRRK